MNTMDGQIQELKKLIAERVFVRGTEAPIAFSDHPDGWVFDFRKIFMDGKGADCIAEIFYEAFKKDYPFQICTMEVAGVPLATALMTKFFEKGHHDVNAVFLRKSRNKKNLMQMVEGELKPNRKIILVDDLINSGDSFWRQVEVIEELGHTIDALWCVLRYRDMEHYKRFTQRGITVQSLFTLDDFTDVLGSSVHNILSRPSQPTPMPFSIEWIFKSDNPSYEYVGRKSQPIIDRDKIYFGSDNRFFWALNQFDGTVAWNYRVGKKARRKSIFSGPAFFEETAIFGAYDGNVYGLSSHDGTRQWMNIDADWIGSSPAVAEDLGLVFIGLEYGLFRKHGGIAAIDARTGKTKWRDTHPALTHASPCYVPFRQEVAIGSNDGKVRLYDARTGVKRWEFTTFGGASYDPKSDRGFSDGDIKESIAYDPIRDYLIFGSIDGFLYILARSTGHLVHHYMCDFGIYSTPYVYRDRVYFTSVDKHVRCIDLETKQLVFEKNLDGTRIFSTPTVINGRLYIGTNAGKLHELDPETGMQLGYFQTRERLANELIYNPHTDRYFLPTYANEIICLTRQKKNDSAIS